MFSLNGGIFNPQLKHLLRYLKLHGSSILQETTLMVYFFAAYIKR
jgi:hypothetical protein